MITTVAITSYNLDCYPEGSGEVVRLDSSTYVMKCMLIFDPFRPHGSILHVLLVSKYSTAHLWTRVDFLQVDSLFPTSR